MSSTRVENNAKFSEILPEPTHQEAAGQQCPDVEVANLRFDLGRRLNNREILNYLMARDALWDGDSARASGVSHQPERMVSVCLQHGSTTMLLNLKRRFSEATFLAPRIDKFRAITLLEALTLLEAFL